MWVDTPERFGLTSRLLHWAMAYLLIWQFAVILTWRVFGPENWVKTVTSFGPDHGMVGLLILVLVVIRAIWGLLNRSRRPAKSSGLSGRASLAVQICFYGLMFLIPALALLRAYGSGKGWLPWIPVTGVVMPSMVAPADLLHGLLAWGLSILIAGHVAMALIHYVVWKDATMSRMMGSLRSREIGSEPTGRHLLHHRSSRAPDEP